MSLDDLQVFKPHPACRDPIAVRRRLVGVLRFCERCRDKEKKALTSGSLAIMLYGPAPQSFSAVDLSVVQPGTVDKSDIKFTLD